MEIQFITYNEASDKEEIGIGGMGGFFEAGMRWEDYIKVFIPDVHDTLNQLRSAIIENNIRCTGDQHQYSNYESVPLFPNGKVATYSYRAWGDLMAAVWSSEENKDYSYMSFYM